MADIKTVIETGPVIRSQFNNGIEGPQGTTAYESAVLGGYLGTEAQFNLDLKAIGDKVDKIAGKGLSTEDYTTSEKSKLAGIEALAEVNNISDINATDLTDLGNTDLHTHKLIQNEVSVNNSKVEALANGAKVTRNIADANPALIVNQVNTSSTGNILNLQFGGVEKVKVTTVGDIYSNFMYASGFVNRNTSSNSTIYVNNDGALVYRNIGDANTCLKINQTHASSTGLITDFQFGGVSKASVDRFGTIANAKSAHNADGGFMIKLTNKTGATSVVGTVVMVSDTTDNAYRTNIVDSDMPIGVVYEAVADGVEGWVVVSGIASVLLVNTVATTRGYVAYSSGTTAGRIDTSATIPAATQHFREIGHTIESKTGGTNVLVKCCLHFN